MGAPKCERDSIITREERKLDSNREINSKFCVEVRFTKRKAEDSFVFRFECWWSQGGSKPSL